MEMGADGLVWWGLDLFSVWTVEWRKWKRQRGDWSVGLSRPRLSYGSRASPPRHPTVPGCAKMQLHFLEDGARMSHVLFSLKKL